MYACLDRSKPCPFPLPATATYLGENELGYYHMDGFFDGVANMFKRMVKFTPKSFTPSNIFKAVRNTTLTTMTGGIYLALPKGVKKTMENVANVALPVAAVGIGAAIAGPAVMSALGPKLQAAASILGKNVSSIGGTLFKAMGSLSQEKQSQVAQQVSAQDIAYAEQHNGQYPAHIQALIDQAEREQFEYAAAQTANSILNPMQRMLPTDNFTNASASLYPGLISQYEKALAQAQQGSDGTDWSPAVTVGALAGGSLLLILLLKR